MRRQRDVPHAPPDTTTTMTRRSALKLMGASVALAMGVPGCKRKPERKIVSLPTGPEYQKPGQALYYASTFTDGPVPYGVIVTTVDGRPVKIEGHGDHPLNRGSTTAAMQACLLGLYDPDRLRAPHRRGQPITWDQADREIVAALAAAESVALVTRATLGPSERTLIGKFLTVVPQARHFIHESVHDQIRRDVWREMFNRDGELVPRLDRARIIVSIDSDFLATDGVTLEAIRHFTHARRPDHATMNRLYVIESAMTVTGSNADHRLRLRPSAMAELVQALTAALTGDPKPLAAFAKRHHLDPAVVGAVINDLRAHPRQSLVLGGPHLPRAAHIAVASLNHRLDAFNHTLEWNRTPATLDLTDRVELQAALAAGVDVVICLDVNPVYDWPAGGFEPLIKKAKLSVAHALQADETAAACTIALPSTHNLEAWNDARPRAGIESLCQPVIAPLYGARQGAESLLIWTKRLAPADSELAACTDWHDYVRTRWLKRHPKTTWDDSLQSGMVRFPTKTTVPVFNTSATSKPVGDGGRYELVIRPHVALHDGRWASNAWLQELPDPVTKIVWDNVAAISPETAETLNVREGEVIDLVVNDRRAKLPVLIQAGVAPGVVAATVGHGRTRAGHVGTNVGTNLAPLTQANDTPFLAIDVGIEKTGQFHELVRTQTHFSMEHRPIALDATFAQYTQDPQVIRGKKHLPPAANIYTPHDYTRTHKWVMAIDLTRCVGCGGCVAACQAENNTPVVGKHECRRGREMHWLRIDTYIAGTGHQPTFHHQPVLCQHCDDAPCENVCPVNATAHDREGLNQMVYNRCIGTRYCSNNCPYKVRRFNFFDYQKRTLRDSVQELVFNPQVTVRSVGIMEKCTFCVQRIVAEKFKAKNADEPLPDNAVQTACQQACPARAIVFGDANNPGSRVAQIRKSPRGYRLLEEFNFKPNVTYLAKIRNPHPNTVRAAHT